MWRWCAAAFAAIVALTGGAGAQNYPSRPISMVVPYPAGGVTDTLARVFAERMKGPVGQNIIVENVGGGSGNIGVARVARAAPDGYTMLMGNAETMVINGAAFNLQHDVVNDFEPIALMPTYAFLIVSTNAVPAQNLSQLIEWIKTNADKVTQGTVGSGTAQHLCGVYLQNRIGVRWQFIPYRGGAPAMQDILTGQFDIMCTASGSFLPLVRNGQIRAYAVTAKSRLSAAPDIPTVDEAGLPGIYVSVWNGLWAPKGTPKPIIAKLNAAAVEALADQAVRKRIVEMGLDLPPDDQLTPEALGTLQKAEIEKWTPIVKAANIKTQ
jgi:tripartite-type tricarboxylate transporter receptor subunit TctC